MKKDNNILIELDPYIELLKSEQLEEIDFDLFLKSLNELKKKIIHHGLIEHDLQILKDDLILRISGMEKAIAAISTTQSVKVEALQLSDELDSYSAESLLEQYKKTQARFRDTFPTSFGTLRHRQSTQKFSDYK